MQWKHLRLLGALFALSLTAAACGSDSSTTDTTSATAVASDDTVAGEAMDDDSEMDDGEHADGDDHDDESHDTDGAERDHGDGIEVPVGMDVPEISIDVQPDPKAGYNLEISLSNFDIAPENASTDPVDGQGHLHLYIDGERVMRFYNEWLHLALEPGMHEIEVEVSANNHTPYTHGGDRIVGTAMVEVPEPDGDAPHSHATTIDVPAESAPTVDVSVFEDPKAGWNVHAHVTDFSITPENASTEHIDGEGHMHLYIDGEKITRLYGNWWHIKALSEGTHTIEVEASANDHSAYAIDGTPIRGVATIEVSADMATIDSMDDSHDDDRGHEDHGDGMAMEDGLEMADADVAIQGSFVEGSVSVDSGDRVEVPLGSIVLLSVDSDVAEEVHLHGYDLLTAADTERTGVILFTADTPGRFEVELERSGLFIVELVVS